jgi:fido (protein-threonine AMPylation protein)
MGDPLDQPEHATPLTPEEREGLISSHVTMHTELNELEQQNILEADTWALSRKRDAVGEPFGRNLHRRMFRNVWTWAGTYRTSDKNLGVEWQLILPRLYEAMEQTHYWTENKWRSAKSGRPDSQYLYCGTQGRGQAKLRATACFCTFLKTPISAMRPTTIRRARRVVAR